MRRYLAHAAFVVVGWTFWYIVYRGVLLYLDSGMSAGCCGT